MKICEVCGIEEEMENSEDAVMQTGLLQVCENCRNDRKIGVSESDSTT
jgi:hypothetical protein